MPALGSTNRRRAFEKSKAKFKLSFQTTLNAAKLFE